MKEQLISFDTAKLAKEKGFENGSYNHYEFDGQIQYCRTSFTNGFMEDGKELFEAPTQSLLQKWLRDEHDIHIIIQYSKYWKGYQWRYDDWRGREHNPNTKRSPYPECKTYEKALEEGLQEALKLI